MTEPQILCFTCAKCGGAFDLPYGTRKCPAEGCDGDFELQKNWGTLVVPEELWVNPENKYRTYEKGYRVRAIQIKLKNECDHEVTFPVKGSIEVPSRGKTNRVRYEYNIWTLDGRDGVHPQVEGRRPKDLVRVEFTREDFTFDYDAYSYMLKFGGRNLGGASVQERKPLRGPLKEENLEHFKKSANHAIDRVIWGLMTAKSTPQYWPIIREVLLERFPLFNRDNGFESA